jgi:purine-binding chemotaxis protein CheW
MPDFIEGIINLRDKIILMIDLRKRFGLPAERSEKARIIIARPSEISTEKQYETESSIGLIVDSVSEVIRLSSQQIDNVPQVISQIDAEYLFGVGRMSERVILLFDLGKVLSELEKTALTKFKERGVRAKKRRNTRRKNLNGGGEK